MSPTMAANHLPYSALAPRTVSGGYRFVMSANPTLSPTGIEYQPPSDAQVERQLREFDRILRQAAKQSCNYQVPFEDCYAVALVAANKAIRRYRPKGASLKMFLNRCVDNALVTLHRLKASRFDHLPIDAAEDVAHLEQFECFEFEHTLAKLPKRSRAVAGLLCGGCKSVQKACRILEIPDRHAPPNRGHSSPRSVLFPMNIINYSRPKTTRSEIEHILALKCVQGKVVVVGVRGLSGKNQIGIYDDGIFIVTPTNFWGYPANVDPSVHKHSIASLKPGKYLYKPGPHGVTFHREGYPYPAFVQADQVVVRRDGQSGDYKGWFGINIHRGGRTSTSSAGCQTVPPNLWDDFHSRLLAELKSAGLVNFTYLLVDAKEVGL